MVIRLPLRQPVVETRPSETVNNHCSNFTTGDSNHKYQFLRSTQRFIFCLLSELTLRLSDLKLKHAFSSSWELCVCFVTGRNSSNSKSGKVRDRSPALCQPKDILFEGGLEPTQIANSEMRNPARSESMWAASVMIARLPAKYPPTACVSTTTRNELTIENNYY